MTTLRRREKKKSPLKTYSCLADARKKPSDYEIATTGLLYYPDKGGFEVETPLQDWYAKHQRSSALGMASDARFADPRQTTYATYVALQKDRETAVDAVLETIERTGYDARLPAVWLDKLELVLPVLRYPGHALSMLAAYVGQMAASGRAVVAAAMQAADEIRRVQRFSYRMVALRKVRPDFGVGARAIWEKDPRWQPLRELVERALVVWDANEALVALTIGIKPAFDELFDVHFAELAREEGDPLLLPIAASLHEDALWHRAWSSALVTSLVGDDEVRRKTASGWASSWSARTAEALAALDPLFAPASFGEAIRSFSADYLTRLGLDRR